ncbi:MAG: hypothetical protein QOH33_560, partial [Paraburkholderia sp.]|nr:hypothetical protein [Paraburkholderia sp.]
RINHRLVGDLSRLRLLALRTRTRCLRKKPCDGGGGCQAGDDDCRRCRGNERMKTAGRRRGLIHGRPRRNGVAFTSTVSAIGRGGAFQFVTRSASREAAGQRFHSRKHRRFWRISTVRWRPARVLRGACRAAFTDGYKIATGSGISLRAVDGGRESRRGCSGCR